MLGPWTQTSPVWEGPRCVTSSPGEVVDMSLAEVLAFGSPTPKEVLCFIGSQPRREQVTLVERVSRGFGSVFRDMGIVFVWHDDGCWISVDQKC